MSAFAPNMTLPQASPLHISKSNTSDDRRSSVATSPSSKSYEKRATNPIKAVGKWVKEKVKGDGSANGVVGNEEAEDDRSRQQEQKSMLKVLSVGSDVFDATVARSPYPGIGF
ncbi:hypothetical protein LTR78_004418 [Recurvomyces mirabilis]|uniref:Uncharacterized protein n=1 Tax=Recurvomyces mirabilis TaxID=574656 RepID=A0AAE1C2Q5_9PEZI|nr:hypothetical protein LTR78_004418 [Recurvomyces mirabilis]KAK5155916.1 hypothetical protein LTS14_005482 [Recurvomyces mirabilis]